MINKNSLNIAKFSFINAIKSKGFIIYNVILLVVMIIATNFSVIKTVLQQNDLFKGTVYSVKVVDNENYLYETLKEKLNVDNVENIEKIADKIKYNEDNLEKEEIIIKVLTSESGEKYLQIVSKEALNGEIYSLISSALKDVRNDEIEAKYGITEEDIQKYNSEVYIEKKILDTDSVIDSDYYIIKTVMIMVIYGLIVFGTSAVASQIANEKTSKSAEYIFTSVSAKDYLNGKVLGANLKTVANMAFMVLYLMLGILLNAVLNKMFNIDVSSAASAGTIEGTSFIFGIDIMVIKYVVLSFIYILLTSTLLSYIQAGMTAKVKSINEMDNSQSITLTLIIVAYVVAFSTSEINNIFTKIIANVPIFSMFAMPSNYLNGVVGIFEIIISIVILLISIVLAMHIVSKKFKQDILDLGPRKEEKRDERLEIIEEETNKVKKAEFKKFITGVAISLLALILVQTVLGLVFAFIIPNATANQNVIAVSLIFVLSFILPIYILKGYLDIPNRVKEDKNKLKPIETLLWVLIALPIMYACTYLVEMLMDKMNINPTMIESALVFDKSIIGKILFFVEIAILPAILEEILFRKVMLKGARKHGTIFAMIFTSVMFGLIHMNIPQAVNAMLMGIIFAYITIKTGTILPVVILHLINNGLSALLMMNENNVGVTNIINYVYIGLVILGTIVLGKKLLKNKKEFALESVNKAKVNIKMVVSNYYMIVLIMFFVIMCMM